MYMRLGFAVAARTEAQLDEVMANIESFQRKRFAKIFEFKQRGGTIVYVSHDAASVERLGIISQRARGGSVQLDPSISTLPPRSRTARSQRRSTEAASCET